MLAAHRGGVVRSASLLVTYPGSAEAAALALELAGLEVGLHLDLVGGRPASDPALVPSLVDDEGRFPGLAELVRRLATFRVSASELAREARAQAARARGWGIACRAWDSHRHTHALPHVARVVGAVAREEGVRWIRRPRAGKAWRGRKPLALRIATGVSEVFYRGIPGNDWYVDVSSWRPRDASAVALLATYGGIGEIGAHPGYADDEQVRREQDLALLTDPLLIAALGSDAVSWRVH